MGRTDPRRQQRRPEQLRRTFGVQEKPVGAYLLQKPSGLVTGLKDAQATMAQQVSGEDFSGDWGAPRRCAEPTGTADLR